MTLRFGAFVPSRPVEILCLNHRKRIQVIKFVREEHKVRARAPRAWNQKTLHVEKVSCRSDFARPRIVSPAEGLWIHVQRDQRLGVIKGQDTLARVCGGWKTA